MATWVKLPPNRHQVSIAGKVIDDQTKAGISGATVRITQAPDRFNQQIRLSALQERHSNRLGVQSQRETSREGCFYFRDLPIGDYTLTASFPSAGTRYQDALPRTVEVVEDHPDLLHLPFVELVLLPTALTGQIKDASNQAIVMAKIWIEGTADFTFSDAQGNYFLNQLEGSNPSQFASTQLPETTVKITAVGYQNETRTVRLQQGTVETLLIQLKQV